MGKGIGSGEGEALELGETLGLGLIEAEGETEPLGLSDGLTDGETLGEILALGDWEAEGEILALGLIPVEASPLISTSPTSVGLALLRVNDAEALEPAAL